MSTFPEPLRFVQAVETEPDLGEKKTGGGGAIPPAPSGKLIATVADPLGESVRTGVWVGLATIAMMFAAFTSAMVVRRGSASDWQHIVLPNLLFVNTGILLVSSVTLEIARKEIRRYAKGMTPSTKSGLGWLIATLGLGLIFVVGQAVVWLQLKRQGVYLASSPTSSFFYVLTVAHAVHVAGGLSGMVRVWVKAGGEVFRLRRSTLDGTAYYWHFMSALWIYLVVLLYWTF